jgi:hypothetical protein
MEGAVHSALETAAAITKAENRSPGIVPIWPKTYDRWLGIKWRLAKAIVAPGALVAKIKEG